jgi:hypothetical protein
MNLVVPFFLAAATRRFFVAGRFFPQLGLQLTCWPLVLLRDICDTEIRRVELMHEAEEPGVSNLTDLVEATKEHAFAAESAPWVVAQREATLLGRLRQLTPKNHNRNRTVRLSIVRVRTNHIKHKVHQT